MMRYKGYVAGPIDLDPEDGTLSARVTGIRDVIHFEGTSAEELQQAFRDSVDAYLASCEADGTEPERQFSGRFPVRVSSELHRRAAEAATEEGVSLNQWVRRQIAGAVGG